MVFLILAAAAITAFGVTKNVVEDNEHRLLRERAAEVSALLRNSVESSNSTLSLLALLAALPDQAGFAQGAGALGRGLGGSVVALTRGDAGFTVAAGSGPIAPGQAVGGDVSALADRALQARAPTVDLVRDDAKTRLAFAAAGPAPTRIVTVLLTDIDPSRPLPRTDGSPFSEMRGALYASPTPDPARLVLTSEESLPLSGDVVEVPFPVGSDKWTLVVKARSSLIGDFPALAPWILLGAGLLAAVLIGAFVRTLARRREFADALVRERTLELESTRAFLERLLVSGPAVVLRTDLAESDRRISYVSPNVERILGLGPAEVLQEGSLAPYLHPDDVELARVTTEQLRDTNGSSSEVEFRIRRPDGSDVWVSGLSVREVDEQGNSTGMFVYITDISKRRAAEDAVRGAQQTAEAANRSKSEFLSRMSHELRTPLNAVLGFSQLLKMQPLPDQESEAVDQILKGGTHLLDLINEVLDISRIEAGRLVLSPEAVLVSELVGESMDLVRAMAEERDVRLVADWAGMDAHVFADRQRAKQVVLNLLSNAVKYNRPRGSVAVSCRKHGATELRISVADTGLGIRPELMGRLFSPFDRLDAGQTDVEGTGIGLALAKSLGEAMGGRLSVESVLGQGSTFSLDLPRVEGPVERYERLQPEAQCSHPCPRPRLLRTGPAPQGAVHRGQPLQSPLDRAHPRPAGRCRRRLGDAGPFRDRPGPPAPPVAHPARPAPARHQRRGGPAAAPRRPADRLDPGGHGHRRRHDRAGATPLVGGRRRLPDQAARRGPAAEPAGRTARHPVSGLLGDSLVMVVDDSSANVKLLQRLLRNAGVTSVEGFTDPAEALTRCKESLPDVLLLDLHMPDLDGFAVLDALRSILPGDAFLPVLVLTADEDAVVKQRALAAGAKDFLTKPFDAIEVVLRVRNLLETKDLYTRLQRHNARLQAELDAQQAAERRLAEESRQSVRRIQRVLSEDLMTMVFQPIVSLVDGHLMGVEALARFEAEPRRPPNEWFAEANAVGLGVELELHAVRNALAQLGDLKPGTYMSVNASPVTAITPGLAAILAASPGDRIVLELTEHTRVGDYEALIEALARARATGVRVAADDTGAGYSGLQHLLRLRPNVIKLDIALTRQIDEDPARRALASALVTFAGEIGAVLVAEGVESVEELRTLRALGIAAAQGYRLARPGPMSALRAEYTDTFGDVLS